MISYTIRSERDLERAVRECGILPFFKNSLAGFSVEEHCAPELWFSGEEGPWEWKGPVIRGTGCAYGKFFEHKAAYISSGIFPDFANWRRDGYDFDARFDDELAQIKDKRLYDLIAANAPVLTGRLKELGNYKKGGNKGFDTIINRLQAQCYVIIGDFVYLQDRKGKTYGWGVAQYTTPERLFGRNFTGAVYRSSPEESYARILAHMQKLLPGESREAIERFLR